MSSDMYFRAAMAGDVEAIEWVGRHSTFHTPTFIRFLPILLTHLGKPVPLSGTNSLENESLLRNIIESHPIIPSLEGLARRLLLSQDTIADPHLFTELSGHWPALRSWLHFGLDLPTSVLQSVPKKPNIFRMCSGIIAWLFVNGRDEIGTTMPGLIQLGVRMYLYALAREESSGESYIEAATFQLLDDTISPMVRLKYGRSELIDALNQTSNSIALILADFKARFPTSIAETSPNFAPLMIMSCLASDINEGTYADPRIQSLHRSFVASGSIPMIISLMKRLDIRCLTAAKHRWSVTLLRPLALYINLSIEHVGPASAVQALENGLLRAMTESFPLLFYKSELCDSVIRTYDQTLTVLQTLLPHPLVFRALHHWIKGRHSSRIPRDQNPVSEAWNSLHASINTMLESRREYKRLTRPFCANIHCPSTATPVQRAKVCSGCLAVNYCSRSCQKDHWAGSHEQKCRPPSTEFSIADGSFLVRDYLAWFFVRQYCSITYLNPATLADARGRYPVVARFPILSLPDDCGPSVVSGQEFLGSEVKWESDELAKEFVRERKTGVVFYFLLADITVPFHFLHFIEA
ncbi:hypothetical protein C8J56DRAFT_963561 [Mycena floridula]|nr:hypothetical protein C8J56DRAFT_963561 [Mycena floridula]